MTGTAALENRIDTVFHRGRPALICYLPLGDPAAPYADARLYADEGVDVLEVGVPAVDANLDGPVIAESMRRAAARGITNARAAEAIAAFRDQSGAPAVEWMSYPSAAKEPGFGAALAASGADGLLIAGAAAGEYPLPAGTHEIQFVPHLPTSEQVTSAVEATGYVMVAADEGLSGLRSGIAPTTGPLLVRLRDAGVTAPLALGFGISDGARARRAVDCGADGVVVGTAVLLAAMQSRDAVRRLLRELRRALDG